MADDNAKRRAARRARVEQGASLDAVAALLNVDRDTVLRWSEEAEERGDDWNAAIKLTRRARAPLGLDTVMQDIASISEAIASDLRDDQTLDPSAKIKHMGKLARSVNAMRAGFSDMAWLIMELRLDRKTTRAHN